MLRNQVAKYLGIDLETIRFYEKEKMISEPRRMDNGYRKYSAENLVELKFIQHCRSLGISLQEIKTLKTIQGQSVDCSEAKTIIEKNIALIEVKMKELKSLRTQLKSLSEACHSEGSAKDCELIKSLTSASKGDSCACHTEGSKKNLKRKNSNAKVDLQNKSLALTKSRKSSASSKWCKLIIN